MALGLQREASHVCLYNKTKNQYTQESTEDESAYSINIRGQIKILGAEHQLSGGLCPIWMLLTPTIVFVSFGDDIVMVRNVPTNIRL